MLRLAARDSRRRVLLALLAAGSTERETAMLRTRDVHIDQDGRVRVTVGGGRGRRRRTLQLVPGLGQAVAQLIAADADGYLIDAGRGHDPAERARRIDHTLRQLLDAVGLTATAGFTATTIHDTGIANIYDRLGLRTAAAVAGTDDATRLQARLHRSTQQPG